MWVEPKELAHSKLNGKDTETWNEKVFSGDFTIGRPDSEAEAVGHPQAHFMGRTVTSASRPAQAEQPVACESGTFSHIDSTRSRSKSL